MSILVHRFLSPSERLDNCNIIIIFIVLSLATRHFGQSFAAAARTRDRFHSAATWCAPGLPPGRGSYCRRLVFDTVLAEDGPERDIDRLNTRNPLRAFHTALETTVVSTLQAAS